MGARGAWRRIAAVALCAAVAMVVPPGAGQAGAAGAPVITGLTPPAGRPQGGDTITIAGRGLSHVAKVHFGSAVSARVKVVSSTRISVVSPDHPVGTVTVRVETKDGSESPVAAFARFTYAKPPRALGWSSPADFDPLSMYNGYADISCATRHVCIATPFPQTRTDQVAPVMLHQGQWTRVRLPASAAGSYARADSSDCPLPVRCLVVGWNGSDTEHSPAIWTWDGSSWTLAMQETPVNGSSVWSPLVCAHGHAYCLVEDPDGVVQIFDNGQWTTTPQQFQPVSCASDTFCIVYTSTGYAVWNGSIVGPGSDPFGNFRPRISCPTDSFCLAVAGSSRDVLQWTYDGITWSAGQGTGLTGYTTEPSCLSATSCWLLTYDYAGGLSRGAHFDGQNWTSARVQSRRFQTSLSCWSADGCRSVDRSADISTLKRGHWHTAQPIPRSGHPNDVSCGSASMCMAVDETGHALRFDGHKWQQPVPIDIHRRLRSVSCPTASFCMAVDDHGYAVRYSGGVWHRPRLALSVSYSYQTIDISCGSPAFCGVVVQDGRAAVYRNDSWHNTPRVLEEHGNSLNAISCTSSRRCVAVGAGMSVYDGRWRHPLASTHYFDDVSCVARTCAAPSRQVWMRNDGVLARSGVPGYGRTICATRHFCLMSASHSRHAVATNGASWADAQVPTGSFVTGDCTKRMCMLLVNAGGVYRQWEETHASA